MAGIDKTYVTLEEYQEVKAFFTPEVMGKMKSDLGFKISPYKWKKPDFGDSEDKTLPIWNTPSLFDLWLARNCNLDCIQSRLKEQYPENWIGWKELNFSEKGFFIKIENKRSWISPFKVIGEKTISTFDEILVYGTTFFDKFLYSAEALVRGEFYNVEFGNDSFPMTVEFELFGRHFSITRVLGENKIIDMEDKQEVIIGYFPVIDYKKDPFDKFFQEIKIRRSNKKSDFLKFEPEQIVMSHEDECFNVDGYKGFKKENYKRYFLYLPNFITKKLK